MEQTDPGRSTAGNQCSDHGGQTDMHAADRGAELDPGGGPVPGLLPGGGTRSLEASPSETGSVVIEAHTIGVNYFNARIALPDPGGARLIRDNIDAAHRLINQQQHRNKPINKAFEQTWRTPKSHQSTGLVHCGPVE